MTPRRRVAVALLALALLLAQSYALVHRAAHAPGLQHGEPASAHAVLSGGHEGNWLQAMFSHEAGDLDCRLLDALGHDGITAAAALTLPASLPPVLLALAEGGCLARWAALFDARGPPSLR